MVSGQGKFSKEDAWWFHYQVPLEDPPWAHKEGHSSNFCSGAVWHADPYPFPPDQGRQGSPPNPSEPHLRQPRQHFCALEPKDQTDAHLLRKAGVQLAPSHMKRDYNQWADELAHPDFARFRPDRQLPVSEAFSQFKFLWPLLGNQPSGLNSKRRRTDPKAT
jgi:hypothetical protein